MEDTSDVTETEAHQATEKKPAERTEINKKPTSGKEIQNESEEKVIINIYLYIFPLFIVCLTSYHIVDTFYQLLIKCSCQS